MIQSAGGPPYARTRHLPPGGLGALLARVADELRTTDLALISPRRDGQLPRTSPPAP
ncbi:MAG TPA: hypothetical protein VF755_28935 [Catenuloplanes sp.]|jgi:hypothetical protein